MQKKRAITAKDPAGRPLGHSLYQALLCLVFLTAPFCPFLSGPKPHQLRHRLSTTHTCHPVECNNTAAPFTQADLLRFWIQELPYLNLVLWRCYYWASWESFPRAKNLFCKECEEMEMSGPSATAAVSYALTAKFRMTFKGQGTRSSKHSLGVEESNTSAGCPSVQSVRLPAKARRSSTTHLAGGRGLQAGPGREQGRSRKPYRGDG